jgi:hypothetical protein
MEGCYFFLTSLKLGKNLKWRFCYFDIFEVYIRGLASLKKNSLAPISLASTDETVSYLGTCPKRLDSSKFLLARPISKTNKKSTF